MSRAPLVAPRRVLLFSGHMIDRFDRPQARFPPAREDAVAARLVELLATLGAGGGDLGICGGAAGGDLLFAEACLGRGLELEILLPQARDDFIAASVDPSGAGWRRRFDRVAAAPGVRMGVMAAGYHADEDLGLYARHTRWLVEHALSWGVERLDVIALWDGRPGDGSGGTAELVTEARRHTDRIHLVAP